MDDWILEPRLHVHTFKHPYQKKMCFIVLAYEQHPRYRLVLATNRDEFYARPTAPDGGCYVMV